MNIPFVLKFLNKIELFQVVKKLDKQFDEHILELENKGGAVPLWQVEKKILFWTYKNHKHLGSPLRVDDLRSKKSYLLKILKDFNTARELIKSCGTNDIEHNLREKLIDAFNGELQETDEQFKIFFRKSQRAGTRKDSVAITATEIEGADIRKVFGNLVSRGYANFYPEITKKVDRYEEERSGNVTSYSPIFGDYTTTQYNCEGIIINKEGILIGELLSNLYRLMSVDRLHDDVSRIYNEKTHNKFYLKKKGFSWFYYSCYIYIGYIALLGIVLLILKEFFNIIDPIMKWPIIGFNLHISRVREIFNVFLLNECRKFFEIFDLVNFLIFWG